MTTPTLSRPHDRTAPAAPGVTARRLRRPSWRDPRLLVGLLLVLLSVVGVAGLLRAVDTTEPVFVARRALTPGQAVTGDDLAVAHVRIVGAGRPYLSASRPLAGLVVVRPVPAGELVPASALGGADRVDLRPITVPVEPAAAGALPRGSVVDVWVASRSADRADSYERPRLVASGVQVGDRSQARAGWGGAASAGSLGSTGSTVQLLLTPALVPELIQAVDNSARITLVPAPAALPRRSGT
ncbi:SAF domain-containing protein [Angustibacter sp. Root456]|uniref:SAF domain-containing protein n=1 Tax=Angustibacter sp. Root456 TaxID=1736539 RepID=UPI00138F65D0|nr:SAF domain-containing protein [Angustibacter sp. Root456]